MNIKKNIMAIGMICTLAVGMATSAFAADTQLLSEVGDSFSSVGNTQYQLNAASSSIPYANTKITMWANTGHPTQRWSLTTFPGTSYYWFQNAANTNVVLSYNGGSQAILSNKSSTARKSQAIKLVNEGVGSAGYVKYGIVLPDYVLAATATSYSNGAQVQWQGPNGLNNQLWYIQMYY